MVKYNSVFDIIGPVMIGPSSSHTAGAVKIGRAARHLFGGNPVFADIHFYGSFAKTYRGHGTDVAIVAGLLDLDTDDQRIPNAFQLAEEQGLKFHFIEENTAVNHPNTVRIKVSDGKESLELVGISVGGGKVEITELNGFNLHLSGNHPAVLIMHNDRFGAIASVTKILAKHEINIGRMEVARKDIGKEALMTIEMDQKIDIEVEKELRKAKHILKIAKIVD
ncbi:L-serine dehydratase [Natronobacillus azotifigens]|uniref:L-serine deaminase n=1 Tax=Natronobacillus azotifigens TaxID=472978 RepID=A0A9J6RD07_9BACI|nr:L-serine ammonia-lyase, iron-sulfur-dependent subunit beta [Natronobacillus azotifigens]MCZ0703389.1 L-serine ammonia-lyase, iron-sulfur-dependent subunit beta [Natronobacillus azotifigens]